MRAEQVAKLTLQVASRVWVIRVTDFSARKKEFEFCSSNVGLVKCDGEERRRVLMRLTWRRRLKGRQDIKVTLLRKELKKVGQAELVKLLPKLVSKGLGSAEVVAALGAVVTEDAEVEVEAEAVVEDGDDEWLEEELP